MQHKDQNILPIIFKDEHIVAINKPPGYVVHRSALTRNAEEIVVQTLRDQIGQKVYPVHRLDRKTSGVLILTLSKDSQKELNFSFQKNEVEKHYLAIVRGWTDDSLSINYPLKNEKGKLQEAFTKMNTLEHYEMDIPLGKFPTSRYSKVALMPKTGRQHQLRKHMAHLFHPIIGDRPHGCNKQNKMWKDRFQINTMLLHAQSISFLHPVTKENMTLSAELNDAFKRAEEIIKENIL